MQSFMESAKLRTPNTSVLRDVVPNVPLVLRASYPTCSRAVLRASFPMCSRVLHDPVPHMPRVLCVLAPCALCVFMLYEPFFLM